MSVEEEGIGCSFAAVPGLPRLAKGTRGYTAPEDRMGFLSLRAKLYPLPWRSKMSVVRSSKCKDRGQRT